MPKEQQKYSGAMLRAVLRGQRLAPLVLVDFLILAGATVISFLLAQSTLLSVMDGFAYDTATKYEVAQPPKTLLVEQDAGFLSGSSNRAGDLIDGASASDLRAIGFLDTNQSDMASPSLGKVSIPAICKLPAERVPAQPAWQMPGANDVISAGGIPVPAVSLPPRYGIHRALLPQVEGEAGPLALFEAALSGRGDVSGPYWPRMPKGQNIPRITASQLVAGNFAAGDLTGLTAIVVPAGAEGRAAIATSLDPEGRSATKAILAAHAVQSLLDRREVQPASTLLALLSILSAALLTLFLTEFAANRRNFIVLLPATVLLALAGGWIVLQTLNIMLPISGIVVAVLLACTAKASSIQRRREHRLGGTIESAIDLAFSRSLFQDAAKLPKQFEILPELLGLPRTAIFMRDGHSGNWRFEHASNAGPEDIDLVSAASRKKLREVASVRRPINAGALTPNWGEGTKAALLPSGDVEYLLLYELPKGKRRKHVRQLLADSIIRARAMRHWQHRLLADSDAGQTHVTLEQRVQSAANLITLQGSELAGGLEALDTGVFVFRQLGLPVHANRQMREILSLAGISPESTIVSEALVALTDLDHPRVTSMIRDVLLHGSEMRVPMRDLGARQRVLRLGLFASDGDRAQSVIVLEAIDVTELDQLAELRLAVGTFIDRQLRNDLEAISLGISLAADPRLKRPALERTVERIAAVARRAIGRLEEVRSLLEDNPGDLTTPYYPIEARNTVQQAIDRAAPFAEEMGVKIAADLPALSGFSLAEPLMLSDMIEAMLRLVIADTSNDGEVSISLEEAEETTQIAISGGFGLPFDRFCAALEASAGEVPVEYQIARAGMDEAIQWKAAVSYYSSAGDGYRFDIKLRRIG